MEGEQQILEGLRCHSKDCIPCGKTRSHMRLNEHCCQKSQGLRKVVLQVNGRDGDTHHGNGEARQV